MNEVTKAALGIWLFVWPIYFPSIGLINTSLQSQQVPSLLLRILEPGLTIGQQQAPEQSTKTLCASFLLFPYLKLK